MGNDLFVLLNDLMPWTIYASVGVLIGELIILVHVRWLATPEEKLKARRISREALKRTAQQIPLVPVFTTPAYESAAVMGPYAIMPVGTMLGFLFVWYWCIPALWVCYQLAVAPPHVQKLFGLMMRCIS